MYTAPGTAIRQNSIGNPADVNTCIRESFKYSQTLFKEWATLSWCSFMILVIFCTYSYVNTEAKKIINPILLAVILFGMFCGILCVPFYPMWSFGAGRVHNVFFFVFFFFSAVLATLTVLYIKQRYKLKSVEHKLSHTISTILVIVFICSFTFNQNSTAAKAIIECKNGVAQSFAHDFDTRIEMIEHAKKNNIKQLLSLKPLNHSELLRFDDITNDTCDWRNKSFCRYFGIVVSIKNE